MSFAEITNLFVSLAWGPWLVFLLVGSGIFFSFFSRFIPFRNLKKGFQYMFQKDSSSEGSISKYQALSSALSGTIGLGNIAGVALAIQLAGPGAGFLDVDHSMSWYCDKVFYLLTLGHVP